MAYFLLEMALFRKIVTPLFRASFVLFGRRSDNAR
jgi:hypothetical protein